MKLIEPLEPRIAPAALFTFTESDGDSVTIKTSKGANTDLAAAVTLDPANAFIASIDLTAPIFAGTNLSIVSKPGGVTGDGFVNLGLLEATGQDLGTVTVDGDLGKILAGDGTATTLAVKSLKTRSFGVFGLATGAPDALSVFTGNVGSIAIKTDLAGASVRVDDIGGVGGAVKSLTVGGSLIGNADAESARFQTTGDLGRIVVGGSLLGGDGDESASIDILGAAGTIQIKGSLIGDALASAQIRTGGAVKALKIGGLVQGGDGILSGAVIFGGDTGSIAIRGSITGGDANVSGTVNVIGSVGHVFVGGDLRGGVGAGSGRVAIESASIQKMVVGGSVIGGLGDSSGLIIVSERIQSLFVRGDLVGGSIEGVDNLSFSGRIAAERLDQVVIGGSIVAGTDDSAGTLEGSGSIHARLKIGKLTVKGHLLGNETNPVRISAEQFALVSGDPEQLGVAELTVGGSVSYAQILAGYDSNGTPAIGYASIGTVKVGGDWKAGDIVASVDAVDGRFGNGDDALIPNFSGLIPRIAQIIIGGQIVSDTAFATRGFVSQEIGLVKIGGKTVALTPGPGNDVLVLGTIPVTTLQEVP